MDRLAATLRVRSWHDPIGVSLVACLVAAFVGGTNPSLATSAWTLALAGVACLLAAAAAPRSGAVGRGVAAIAGVLALLAVWYLVTRGWAIQPAGSMLQAARFAGFGALILAAAALGRSWWRNALLGLIAVFGVVIAANLVFDLATQNSRFRSPGLLGYWNASGLVALWLVPVAVVVMRWGSRLVPPAAAVLLALASSAAIATASRGALLSVAVGLTLQVAADRDRRNAAMRAAIAFGLVLVAVALATIQAVPVGVVVAGALVVGAFAVALLVGPEGRVGYRAPDRRTLALLGAMLVLGSVVAVLAWLNPPPPPRLECQPPRVSRLASIDDSRRLEWWGDATDYFAQRPVAGWGGEAFLFLRAEDGNESGRPESPHSLPLQVGLEAGVIGVLLLGGALLAILLAARRARGDTASALALAIGVSTLVQSSFDWTLWLPAVLAASGIALGIAFAPDARVPVRRGERLGGWALALVLAVICAVPLAATVAGDSAADAVETDIATAADRGRIAVALVPDVDVFMLTLLAVDAVEGPDAARVFVERNEKIWWYDRTALKAVVTGGYFEGQTASRLEERLEELKRRARAAEAQRQQQRAEEKRLRNAKGTGGKSCERRAGELGIDSRGGDG